MPTDLEQRAERVRAPPVERAAPLGRQRLGQHERSRRRSSARLSAAAAKNGARGPRPPSRPPSAGPRMNPTPNAALIMPKLCARFSGGLMSATYAYAGVNDAPAMPDDRAADEQPAERRREAHHQVVDAEAADRDEQHRAAAEAVGQVAEDRARTRTASPRRRTRASRRRSPLGSTLSPVSSTSSVGSTGMMSPKPIMSSSTVMATNVSACREGARVMTVNHSGAERTPTRLAGRPMRG